jgi:hypothetical protein
MLDLTSVVRRRESSRPPKSPGRLQATKGKLVDANRPDQNAEAGPARLLDAQAGDGSGDHQLLDLLGAFKDVEAHLPGTLTALESKCAQILVKTIRRRPPRTLGMETTALTAALTHEASQSVLVEEVLVHLKGLDEVTDAHANLMFNHQVGKLLPV